MGSFPVSFWRWIPGFWRNFVWGLLIAAVLYGLDRVALTNNIRGWSMDLMIRANASLAPLSSRFFQPDSPKFAYFDMSKLNIGKPDRGKKTCLSPSSEDGCKKSVDETPYDNLLKLIQFAAAGRAEIIIVAADIEQTQNNQEAGRALREYVLNYPSHAPPLIFTRPVNRSSENGQSGAREFLSTILDEVKRPNVHFARPSFYPDSKDGIVRRWALLEQGCLHGKGLALPSVQLLALALLRDRKEGGARNLSDLQASLNANRPFGCATGERVNAVRRPVVMGNEIFRQQRAAERLVYSFYWPQTGRKTADLATIPADLVADGKFSDLSRLTGRISLIGTNSASLSDLYRTPVGLMPTILVTANGIRSLSLYGQVERPLLHVRLLFMLSFITVLSFVFSGKWRLAKLLIAFVLAVLFFQPLGLLLFKYGMWFDFGVLLLGIGLLYAVSVHFEWRELKNSYAKTQGPADNADNVSVGEVGGSIASENAGKTALNTNVSKELCKKPLSGAREVTVQLYPAKNGGFRVETSLLGEEVAEFELGPGDVKRFSDGFILALKQTKPFG